VPFEGAVEGKIAWMRYPSRIPVYVAASSPRLTRAAGRVADGALLHHGASVPRLERAVGLVRAGNREGLRDEEVFDIMVWTPISVSPDRDLARDHIRGRVAALLGMADLEQFDEEDRPAIRRLRQEYDYYEHATAGPGHRSLVPDKFIDMYTLAGTAEEVRVRVKEMLRVRGFSQLVISPQVAGGRFPSVESIIEGFAEGVMAHVA
jgi:5,10-methylenetetrahydromethanopterin reductase